MKFRVRRIIRHIAIVITSSTLIFFAFRLTQAGSLTPPAATAPTFNVLEDIYDSLVSASFDSSSIPAAERGSTLQMSKCIINQMTGGTCP